MSYFLDKLRSQLLSPNSAFELTLRTWYHRLSATRAAFRLQAWLAKRSYEKYRSYQNSLPLPDTDSFTHQPKVSFILNCDVNSIQNAKKTIDSIQRFTCPNWEILLLHPDSPQGDPILSASGQDPRINAVIDIKKPILSQISGDYFVFCAPGDVFHEDLLIRFYESLNNNPAADVFYYDCEYHSKNSARSFPLFKPASHSPELLLSVNHYSRGLIRKTTLKDIPWDWDAGKKMFSTEYDLMLRLSEQGCSFQHIPYLLLAQIEPLPSPDTTTDRTIISHLSRLGLERVSSKKTGGATRFSWWNDDPSIAIIIPSKDHCLLLKNLIDSILEKTDYAQYTINIVDNQSEDKDTLEYYKDLRKDERFSIIPYDSPFNYSQAINLGVEKTESDLVLFLNDDMEVIDPYWLSELAQWASRRNIGVVGAKLFRENKTIQHAGIIIGLNGFAGHIYLNTPENYDGLFGSANWYRNYLALTGACQIVKRELFAEVGGYDERYRLAFGDIDFCLRVHELGFRNVYNPFARLFHYEGKSRGYQTPIEDIKHGFEKLQDYLVNNDPCFSPNLTYTRIPKCVHSSKAQAMRKQHMMTRRDFYQQRERG